jgi:hypothetical protein
VTLALQLGSLPHQCASKRADNSSNVSFGVAGRVAGTCLGLLFQASTLSHLSRQRIFGAEKFCLRLRVRVR